MSNSTDNNATGSPKDTNQQIMPHKARKRFGQNFLVDNNIIDKIVTAINPKKDDTLIEIGPGQGALTDPLLQKCPSLNVVELDKDLIPRLRVQFFNYPEFTIHEGDALKFDFTTLVKDNKPLRIVGNLPYNISTPLMFHLLSYGTAVKDMHFMLQKEVVDRLTAAPGEKAYGRLGIMVQYYCKTTPLVHVPPTAFRPMPKVDSAVVRLEPRAEIKNPAHNIELLKKLVNACFQQRRKTLRNTLKHFVDSDKLNGLNIDISLRPEKLSVNDFVNLSNEIDQL